MKKIFIILILISGYNFLFSALLLAQNKLTKEEHRQKIEKERQDKDQKFKEENSPLAKEKRPDFKGLNYYPIDYQYFVKCKLIINKKKKTINFPTTTKRIAVYKVFGKLIFELNGQPCSLTVYQNVENKRRPEYADYLFVPFRDLTSNQTTYGGGRYLDFRIPKAEEVWLDFNTAYNPYCAYSYEYSCPIPPKENTLKIAIEAGETNFE
jgi:uncharacterized protein (DUF1684 family)